jgi:ketosteroid isomerase-like protein
MSQDNVEILKHSFEEAPENPEPFFAIFDENVEWDMSVGPFPIQKKVYGPEAVREFFRTWAGTFDDWGFEAEEIIDAGSSVFVCLHQWGRGKGSGIPVENRFFTVWTFERDRVIRYQGFGSRTEALDAAGLSE